MIIFYDDLAKSTNPIETALKQLRSFLDAAEPSLIRVLVNTWNAQGKAITYKELREAILYAQKYGGPDGCELVLKLYDEWRQDYSRLVVSKIAPRWENAINEAVARISRKYPKWSFNATTAGVDQWARDVGAQFVTNSTNAQIMGLRELVRRAASMQDMNVDTLSRVIRPMVGLTRQQASSNMRYYKNLLEHGVSQKQALDLSVRYGARQHRYRAQNIARTELAFAYNKGADTGVRQAQEQGYMGKVVKEWCTALDERVCTTCSSLDGVQVGMDEEFNFKTRLTYPGIRRTPPAHPSCRCVVLYKEVEPPIF